MSKTTVPANEKDERVVIPCVLRRLGQVWIRGKTPLIVHQMSGINFDDIERGQTGVTAGPVEKRDPHRDFENAKYIVEVGGKPRDAIKAIGFKRGMELWAKDTIKSSKQKIRGGVDLFGEAGELALLRYSRCTMRTDRVKIAHAKTTLAYRPQYDDWSTVLLMEWDPTIFTAQALVTLLHRVGEVNGVGELRPQQCGDVFGKFVVEHFESLRTREEFPKEWQRSEKKEDGDG